MDFIDYALLGALGGSIRYGVDRSITWKNKEDGERGVDDDGDDEVRAFSSDCDWDEDWSGSDWD